MPVEVAKLVDDFNKLWPRGTDPVSKADDHIRMIKEVLQLEFELLYNKTRVFSFEKGAVVNPDCILYYEAERAFYQWNGAYDVNNEYIVNAGSTPTTAGGIGGNAWTRSTGSGFMSTVLVSDTEPTAPFQNMLWWDTNSGTFFIYYNDGTSTQWVDLFGIADQSSFNTLLFRSVLASLAAESGYTLVGGSFQEGAISSGFSDVVLDWNTAKFYQWHLNENKEVPAGSTPETSGGIGAGAWVDRTNVTLRSELGYIDGLHDISVSVVVGDGVTDNRPAVSAANALGRPIKFVGVSVIGSSLTITAPIVDTMQQIFSEGSVVTIDNNQPVRPEWFGWSVENIKRAVDSLPATGGVVKLESRRYPRSYSMDRAGQGAGIAYLSKPNVSIIGAKTPHNNPTYTTLEGGTVIDGPFHVFAQGFYGDKFGVDSGFDTCARLWEGIHPDAFNMATTSESGGVVLSASLGTIAVMGGAVDALSHGLLVQGHKRFEFDTIYAYTQAHGVAIKCEFVTGKKVHGVGNTYEALILKSNAATPMRFADIESVTGAGLSSYESGAALVVHAADADIHAIHVGTVLAQSKNKALQLIGESANLYGVVIDNVIPEMCRRAVDYADTTGKILSSYVGHIEASGTDDLTSIPAAMTTRNNRIGSATMKGYFNGLIAAGTIVIDSFSVSDMGVAVNISGAGKVLIGKLLTTGGIGSTHNIPLTLSANWSLGAELSIENYGCKLAGFVYAGAGAGATIVAAGVIQAGMRPLSEVRKVVATSTGSATVILGTDGSISLSSAPVAGTTVYLDGVEWSV